MDTKGDGIKVKDTDGLSFVNVGALWNGEADESNGAYGDIPLPVPMFWWMAAM